MTTNLESIIRRYVGYFNNGDLDGYLELYVEDATLHYLPPGLPGGVAGARLFYGMFMVAFPDIHVDIREVLADGDRAAVRIILTGTHKGELMGVPASGKPISVSALYLAFCRRQMRRALVRIGHDGSHDPNRCHSCLKR